MNNEPGISTADADAKVAASTAPKVTKESMEAKIAAISYVQHNETTICLIEMKSGFVVTGVYGAASKANFDPEVGKRYAYDAALKALWPLEGYALRDASWKAATELASMSGQNNATEGKANG